MQISNLSNIDPQYLGHALINKGFKTWVRYMFKVVEGKDFIVEELHSGLFEVFADIYSQKVTRQNINVPPRSGKTTLGDYFIPFCLAQNSKCNFIYTSFSQSLLAERSRKIAGILENPIYKAMYPNSIQAEEQDESPIDNFWADYLKKESGKNIYSAKKIVTKDGGVLLFSSIGSTITGHGAGIRSNKGFSGALIIDDANKPADIYSKTMREKVLRYFEETLLSRLNDSSTPIINIQQRLHLEDLSGFLQKSYNFNTLKRPLVDNNGVCLLPKQYTPDRIVELQKNNYMFKSQFQQEPITAGGQVIKSEWFNFYDTLQGLQPTKLFFTADTALKTGEQNDYSVFCAWIIANNNLYLIDILRGKWEVPDLKKIAVNFINKYKAGLNNKLFNCMYVEDKASGTGLIQELKRDITLPVIPVQRTKDKYTRLMDVISYLEAGRVYLPFNKDYAINKDLIAECEEFTQDFTHKNDDIIDNLIDAINKGLVTSNTSWLLR